MILSADSAAAWYIPNRSDLASLDSYLVSITELEAKLCVVMVGIDAPESLKASRAPTTWAPPAGCSLSWRGGLEAGCKQHDHCATRPK